MYKNQDTFHRAIFPVLFVAQLFGLLPVQGVSSNNVASLKFQWISYRVFHSCLVVTVGSCFVLAEIINLVEKDMINAKNCGKIVLRV